MKLCFEASSPVKQLKMKENENKTKNFSQLSRVISAYVDCEKPTFTLGVLLARTKGSNTTPVKSDQEVVTYKSALLGVDRHIM